MKWRVRIAWWIIFCIRYSRIIWVYNQKKHEAVTDNLSTMMIYVNKIENRITSNIKTGYYLKLLTLETVKLLRGTKSKIDKDKNSENMPHLEITEVV